MNRSVVVLALSVASFSAYGSDACRSLIPVSLQTKLAETYDRYRLPRESDNLAEDVQNARLNGTTSCLGAVTADFDGDHRRDFLVALSEKTGSGSLVVVALAQAHGWRIKVLEVQIDDRSRLYVSSASAGTYNDVGDYGTLREKGAVGRLKCRNAVAILGETESSVRVYCLVNATWKHVWVSD